MILVAYLIIALVVLQRAGELMLANRNTQKLKAQGAVEIGAEHYPLIVLLHMAWLLAVLWLLPAPLVIYWGWIAVFVLLQAARVWVIASLGPYWTTRIISVARRAAGQARALPFRASSQLSGGGGRDRGAAAGFRRNRGRDRLSRSPMRRYCYWRIRQEETGLVTRRDLG